MPRKDKAKHAEYCREWYQDNKAKAVESRNKWMAKQREWYQEYKQTLQCQRCPENHPSCMVFHHRDRDSKEINIANAIAQGWSQTRILQEIAKCDVLCSNCHMKLHYELNSGDTI